MKGLIIAAAPHRFGLGHWTRANQLARAAAERGWDFSTVPYTTGPAAQEAIQGCDVDWLIFDIPEPVPDWAFEGRWKVCILNGIGRDPEEERADLLVIQGLYPGVVPKNAVAGPAYVILRPQIFLTKPSKLPVWLVWDGYLGGLGLHEAFARALPGIPAVHLLGLKPIPGLDSLCVRLQGDEVIPWLAAAWRACVAMGMIVWELVALRKPCHVFSASPLHLAFALEMAKAGLVMAWPEVGLPGQGDFTAFLAKAAPTPEPPPGLDGYGAFRILDELEDRS